jgi:hypothetical protein
MRWAVSAVQQHHADLHAPAVLCCAVPCCAVLCCAVQVLCAHPQFRPYFTDADLAVLDYLVEVGGGALGQGAPTHCRFTCAHARAGARAPGGGGMLWV